MSHLSTTLRIEAPASMLFALLTGNRIEREFRRSYDNLKRLAETALSRVQLQASDDDAADEDDRLATG
jgi:hypothetical protein